MKKTGGYRFNTFSGVFLPSILTILGVVMYLRLGTVIGDLGLIGAIGILIFAESIAVSTGLAISSISTNTPVLSGGPYFLISRSLGPGFGSSIGLAYYLAQSLSVPFYILGFTEAMFTVFPDLMEYRLWVSMIPLMILALIAVIGANWAIRTQFAIMLVLLLSIVVMLGGALFSIPTPQQFAANWMPSGGKSINLLTLASGFAVFFPAVTGFLAGVNMSGDLEDARKSIPRGTITAIMVGFVLYAVEILLFGAAWSGEAMSENFYGVLVRHALFGAGFLVLAGMAAATLSSALGTLIGAPRVLQAFAADRIFPPFNFFARGRGPNREPVAAMMLTLILSVGTVIWASGLGGGSDALNAVAELVTLFMLCTYAIINIAASVESFAANPSFRPKFRFFHWIVGFYGAAACLVAALIINAGLLLIALAVIEILFLLARRRSLERTFGDARRGYYFEHIRRALMRLSALPPDPKNWRPQITVLAGTEPKHLMLIRFAALLNNNRGILTVARLQTLPPGGNPAALRRRELAKLNRLSAATAIHFFPSVAVIEDDSEYDRALPIFLQAHSLGPLAPNIVFCGWPTRQERAEAFCAHLQEIRRQRMNSLVMVNPERAETTPDGPVDIWWRGKRNGELMLILAHLLTCNRLWRKTPIRLLRITSQEDAAKAQRELHALTEDSRIETECVVLVAEDNFEEIFRKESAKAAVIFLGFVPPAPEESVEVFDRITRQLAGMPATFLVASAGDTDIDS